MIKNWIYSKFAEFYIPNNSAMPLKIIAQLAEKLLGYAVFNYSSVMLTAGPYALLDHYIIRGYNINPHCTSALSQYLSDGDVFLDIGANHGVFYLLAARNPKIKVFAFEPSPRELSRFWKNLQLNNKHNISVLAYGLGEEEKEQDFALSADDNPGMNSLPTICEKGTRIKCHFSTLLKLLSADVLKQARVCKLDVEGQEMFILNSLRSHMDILKKCVFVIEMSPRFLSKVGFSTDEIYQFFNQAGFKHQFGNPYNAIQWEEFFYHPAYTSELVLSENFDPQ